MTYYDGYGYNYYYGGYGYYEYSKNDEPADEEGDFAMIIKICVAVVIALIVLVGIFR